MAILLGVLAPLGPACDRERAHEESDGLTGGQLVFEEPFDGPELGEHWRTTSEAWHIQDGTLHIADAQNAPLWLDVTLPEQVRLEFDAVAESPDGDLKFEIFGDGATHQSGYIAIYGGWRNTVTCIARLNEHGDDRLDADHHEPVEVGHTYHMAAVRTDHRIRWYIDGRLALSYDDSEPLQGDSHRYFAFNNWQAAAHFDNVEIYDLSR